MSPVDLTNQEWDTINAGLFDCGPITDRVIVGPYVEWISGFEFQQVGCVRLSRVCLYDAANDVRNAHYALGQAIAVRKYFGDRSKSERDNDAVLADVRSRFYADYVPLLLWSAGEHTCTALVHLFDLDKAFKKYGQGHDPRVHRVRKLFEGEQPGNNVTKALIAFDDSQAREKVAKYRNNWVHNKPPRVESLLYNPPRVSGVTQIGNLPMMAVGYESDPDYMWNDLIAMLNKSLGDIAEFLNAAQDEWEVKYKPLAEAGWP